MFYRVIFSGNDLLHYEGSSVMAEKLNANDTLSKVLAYVDSPFKLFALILMAVLALAVGCYTTTKT